MPAHCRILFLVLSAFISKEALSQHYEGDACRHSSEQSGVCKPLDDCEEVIRDLVFGIKPYNCGISNQRPIVCCPEKKSVILEKQSNSQQKCMEFIKATLIKNDSASSSAKYDEIPAPPVIGGEMARPAEFPHMAALGYGDETDISWLCGGSLISERFVLSAAHCLAPRGRGLVRWVQLGDLNLVTTDDAVETQQFAVESMYRHPDYEPPARYNDIGLLKLDRNVKFTAFVRPACIHAEDTLPNAIPEAIGWGLIEWGTSKLSDHLLKVYLKFVDMAYCNRTYAPFVGSTRLRRGIDEQTMLCVGELAGGKDTCQRDSGGPLHVHLEKSPTMFEIVGITSFGIACGDKNTPAVYTKVSYFVPWIESIVWP